MRAEGYGPAAIAKALGIGGMAAWPLGMRSQSPVTTLAGPSAAREAL